MLKTVFENKSVRNYLIPALIFAVFTLVVFRNYFSGSIFVGTDGMGLPTDLSVLLQENSYFHAWRDMPSLGHMVFPSPVLNSGYFILQSVMGLSPDDTFRVFILGFFWLAGFAMYLCAYRITKSPLAAVAAGIIYIFSQVYVSQITELHHLFIAGHAVFPFLFLALYVTITERKTIYAVLIPVFAFILGTAGAPHTILISAVFLLLFILVYALQTAFKKHYQESLCIFSIGLVAVIILVLPTVLSKFVDGGMYTLSTVYPIEEAQAYSSYSLLHSFLLFSTENKFIDSTAALGAWTIARGLWPLGYVTAAAAPILAFYALKVKKERLLLLSLAVPSIIFIFLACGPNPPFGPVFEILFDNVPLMDSIRVYSRLHLLTTFAYAMMIAVLISHADEVRKMPTALKGTWKRVRKGILHPRTLAVLISACMIFSSSAVLSGEVKSFDLPDSYSAPYKDLAALDGGFRIINLPYSEVYYELDMPRYDGYPGSQTPEVGMYSPYISEKMYAFGLETQEYWTFVGSALFGEKFGYKNLSELLGGTADVRFIVSQVHADDDETKLFASLKGMIVWKEYEGGALILENGLWEDRVHEADSSLYVIGSRQYLLALAGMNVADLSDMNVLAQYSDEDLKSLIAETDGVVISSLTDCLIEMSSLKDSVISLSDLGETHTRDDSSHWLYSAAYYLNGLSPYAGVYTTSSKPLSFEVNAEHDGSFRFMLDLMMGPEFGSISVAVDGKEIASVDCSSMYDHSSWVEVSTLNLSKGSHTITVTASGPVCLMRALLTDASFENADADFSEFSSSVVIPAVLSSMWNGTFLSWHGEEGSGFGSTSVFYPENNELSPGSSVTFGKIFSTPGAEYHISLDMTGKSSISVEIWNNGSIQEVHAFTGGEEANFTYTAAGDSFSIVVKSVGYEAVTLNSLTVSLDNTSASTVLNVLSAGEYILRVAGEGGSVFLDGIEMQLEENNGFLETRVSLSRGAHVFTAENMNLYGVALISESSRQTVSPEISYVHKNNISYEIKTSSDHGFWLMVCDSYSDKWTASINGEELLHAPANSMVNAYYVPAGEHTIQLTYEGQKTYNTMLVIYAAAVLSAAAAVLAAVWCLKRKSKL